MEACSGRRGTAQTRRDQNQTKAPLPSEKTEGTRDAEAQKQKQREAEATQTADKGLLPSLAGPKVKGV
jgi:hypothetical protein